MIIKTLKSILPSYNGKNHSDFNNLIEVFPKEYMLENSDVDLAMTTSFTRFNLVATNAAASSTPQNVRSKKHAK